MNRYIFVFLLCFSSSLRAGSYSDVVEFSTWGYVMEYNFSSSSLDGNTLTINFTVSLSGTGNFEPYLTSSAPSFSVMYQRSSDGYIGSSGWNDSKPHVSVGATRSYSLSSDVYSWIISSGDDLVFYKDGVSFSLLDLSPPPPIEFNAQTFDNPFAQTMWLEVDGAWYSVPAEGYITLPNDGDDLLEGVWYTEDQVFSNGGGESIVYDTIGEGTSTNEPVQVITFDVPPDSSAPDIFTPPSDPALNPPYNSTQVIDGNIWIVDENGNIVGYVTPDDAPNPNEAISFSALGSPSLSPDDASDLVSEADQRFLDDSDYLHEMDDSRAETAAIASANGASAGQSEKNSVPTLDNISSLENAGGGSVPSFVINMPSMMGGATVDLNPFRADRMGGIAAGVRSFITVIVLLLLAKYCSEVVYDCVRDFNLSPQAVGNNVFGGTGAQATALISAGIITVAVASGIVAVSSVLTGQFALPALYSVASSNPLANMSSGVVWMLDQLFPLGVIFGAAGARVVLRSSAAGVLALTAAVVRFVVL